MSQYISCDQVVWLQNALNRYAKLHHETMTSTRCSEHYQYTHQLGCIVEIMEVLGLKVQDDAALGNLLSWVKHKVPQDKNTDIQLDARYNPLGSA